MFKIEELDEFWFRFKRQFFRKIFTAFKASGLSQKNLAEKTGKDTSRINKWLRGDENMTLRTMYVLSRAMGLRPEINLVPIAGLKKTNQFHDQHALYNISYPQSASSGCPVEMDMATEESLTQIIDAIFALSAPKIEEDRRENITNLVRTTVNGDDVKNHLAFNASVKPNIMGALVYILTNRRIIKFDIDPVDIKSVSFPLDTIISVERSLEGNRAGVQLSFQTGSFGVKYNTPNLKIEDFFQKVDQARVSKNSGGAV